MKKYLLLIPTLFIMLLNVIGCGQVVFNASAATDYSDYFLDYTLSDPFDCTYDKIFPILTENIKKQYDSSAKYCYSQYNIEPYSFNNYFYSCVMHGDNVTSWRRDPLKEFQFKVVFFDCLDSEPELETDEYIYYYSLFCYELTITYNPLSDTYSYGTGSFYQRRILFRYGKQSGFVDFSSSSIENMKSGSFPANSFLYTFYQDSNISDFPFADGLNHSGSSDQLKVDVHFKPTLSGKVDRLITDSNGDTSLANRMRFTLTNNSKFPIQYELFIVKKSADFDVTAPYNDSYVFMYYSNSWVYAPCIDDMTSWNNQLPQKQNKSSPWHYVKSGETVGSFFNYSQINLVESQDYTVYVTATRCDYDLASECVVSPVEEIYSDMKQVHRAEVVFQSDFSMVHYSDVKYDPNDNSNGVIPFSSYEDIQKNHFSYNAKEDPDGKIDYNAKDVYSDKNSWWNNPSSGLGSSGSSGSSSSSASSNFNSLSRSFSNFFSFVNTTFNYFPSSFKLTISLGLTSIVVLGLIKAVFK